MIDAKAAIDPRTGRPLGDHGPAQAAIDYVLATRFPPGEESSFLRCWREGDLDEWPEFYPWLQRWEARR